MSQDLPPAAVLPRWDAVVISWELSPEERTVLLAATTEGPVNLVETYRPAEAERRMRLVIELSGLLDLAFDDQERVRRWLRRPLAALCDRTPIEAMATSTEWTRRLIEILGAFS
ncbi:MAG: MbcA/ParS/Xre antitoxin family protein [Pseudomonadota bacterium]|nr:MbcA/ParS/Xre antitoxin family protein [Pseudomonadota bacterium]